ncbi:uncharacterized protein LOC144100825 [Amblyomma americanum]|uniref:Uncharacterized protein n=1 Tax=Amblyomma americanum TaxID=6943 RepID=A0AAQ4D9W2_AMBAM
MKVLAVIAALALVAQCGFAQEGEVEERPLGNDQLLRALDPNPWVPRPMPQPWPQPWPRPWPQPWPQPWPVPQPLPPRPWPEPRDHALSGGVEARPVGNDQLLRELDPNPWFPRPMPQPWPQPWPRPWPQPWPQPWPVPQPLPPRPWPEPRDLVFSGQADTKATADEDLKKRQRRSALPWGKPWPRPWPMPWPKPWPRPFPNPIPRPWA